MRRLRRLAVDYLIAFFVIMAGVYAFYWVTPTSFWLTYHAVVLNDADGRDGVIEMRSVRTILRTSDIGGLDVLFCDLDDDGEYGHFSSQPWQADGVRPNDGPLPTGPWGYAGRLPAPGTSCLMRSVVTLRLPFTIARRLEAVYSDPFLVEPLEPAD